MDGDIKLPPLPDPDRTVDIFGHDCSLFTRSKLMDYARAAVLADRERRGELLGYVSQHNCSGPYQWQFHKNPHEVYPDTCISVTKVYTAPRPDEYKLKDALEKIEVKAQAGLCYFTLESAREFLKDIRDVVADALGKERPTR